jgi:hypothetical protein
METATYCAYNITRNALLSEQAASVTNIQDPAQLLALVLNGPGRDPNSAVFLRGVTGPIDIPRLFAFDVAFLDDEQRIIEAASVGPGTPFPPLDRAVASILFLSDQCLAKSSTVPGDVIKICTEAEFAVLLRAASQTQPPDTFQQPKILPEVYLDFRQSIEPFDGSLIYLPTSGTPQSSEFFLPIAAPRVHAPEPSEEQIIELTPIELSASEAQIVDQPGPIEPPELPGNFGSDLDEEPEVPRVDTPEPVRFLVLPTIREAPGVKQVEPAPEAESPHPPQLTGLSPQLKAIIQKVDEQLRRERETPEEREPSEQIPQGESASAISNLTSPADSIQTEQIPAGLQQELPTPPQAENAEPIFSASIENTQNLNDEIHAAPPDELKAAEPLPPRPISKSRTKAPRARKVSRKAHPASTIRKSDPRPAELHPIERQPMPPQPTPAQENPPPVKRSDDTTRAIPTRSERKLSFAIRVQRWLAGESISLTGNRRRGERINVPGLVAFYWTGGAPTPHEIVNISKSGLYLRSKELWSPDTLVRMTLERPGAVEGEQKSISVLVRVVRSDDGGVAHEFVTTEVLDHLRARDIVPEQGTNRKKLEKFLELH